jgi:hypothetical protein
MHSICFNKLITLVFLYFLVLFCLVSTFQFLLVSFETITGSIIRIRLSNLASISLRKKMQSEMASYVVYSIVLLHAQMSEMVDYST